MLSGRRRLRAGGAAGGRLRREALARQPSSTAQFLYVFVLISISEIEDGGHNGPHHSPRRFSPRAPRLPKGDTPAMAWSPSHGIMMTRNKLKERRHKLLRARPLVAVAGGTVTHVVTPLRPGPSMRILEVHKFKPRGASGPGAAAPTRTADSLGRLPGARPPPLPGRRLEPPQERGEAHDPEAPRGGARQQLDAQRVPARPRQGPKAPERQRRPVWKSDFTARSC